MWREPLGRALTRQTDGVNPTILDDPLEAKAERHAGTARGLHHLTEWLRSCPSSQMDPGSGSRPVTRCAWTGHRRESLDKETRRSLPADSPFWARRKCPRLRARVEAARLLANGSL